MYSEVREANEFDFGIDRLLSEGIYAAAYPLHDVSELEHHTTLKLPQAQGIDK